MKKLLGSLMLILIIFLCNTGFAVTNNISAPLAYGTVKGQTSLYTNSPDIHNGATLYTQPDASSTILGKYPNGTHALLLELNKDHWVHVQVSANTGRIEGYMKESELTPIDGSYGLYPLSSDAYLYNFTYIFASSMPSDVQSAFLQGAWDDFHPIIGGIAANGCNIAAVVMQNDRSNILCILKHNGKVWEIAKTYTNLLYQGAYVPQILSFSSTANDFWYEYPASKDGYSEHFFFQQPSEENAMGAFYLKSYSYSASEEHMTATNNGTRIGAGYDDEGYLRIRTTIDWVENTYTTSYKMDDFAIQDMNIEEFHKLVFGGNKKPF